MQAFSRIKGVVVPFDQANVDTDQIIPKQYLKSIKRTGFGPNLFDDWRYLDPGEPGMDTAGRRLNPEFILNLERYQGAQVLLARKNFGCGSSREHAPWALLDFGFRVLIAPSFADIFYNNCFKNGILIVTLSEDQIDRLFSQVEDTPGYSLDVDLESQCVTTPDGKQLSFEIEPGHKQRLLQGLDDIGLTLRHTDDIQTFEAGRRQRAPWLFTDLSS